ncbi:MAG: ankyrin repeat domain-containing protein, partial [Leptospiraceae bacterium]|nr:ankyrin repeat domain-containing protein [Leptospiraceae bacterium]
MMRRYVPILAFCGPILAFCGPGVYTRAPVASADILLSRSINSNDMDGFERALEIGVHINGAESYESPLTDTIESERLAMAERLLKAGADPDGNPKEKIPPIFAASQAKESQYIEMLLEAGADPNRTYNDGGETPLHWSARSWEGPAKVRALLRAGANPNVADRFNRTPLFSAKGPEATRLLLEAGADPNVHDIRGSTPAMGGFPVWGDGAKLRVLVEHGYDLDATDRFGQGIVEFLTILVSEKDANVARQLGAKWEEAVFAPAGLRIRSGPGLSHDSLGTLPYGTTVEILETEYDQGRLITVDRISSYWVKVRTPDLEGWVFKGLLSRNRKLVESSKPCGKDSLRLPVGHCVPLWAFEKIGRGDGYSFNACSGGGLVRLLADGTVLMDNVDNVYEYPADSCEGMTDADILTEVGSWSFSGSALILKFNRTCKVNENGTLK